MAGNINDGTINNCKLRESRAYCEGRSDAANSVADGYQGPAGFDSDAYTAGFDSWVAEPVVEGGDVDCCDLPYGGGYVVLVAAPVEE